MEYDFTQIPNRFDSYSLKWHVGAHELPMWVADMDFKIASEILQALQKILNHSSPAITLRYIGVDQDEIDLSYNNFEL